MKKRPDYGIDGYPYLLAFGTVALLTLGLGAIGYLLGYRVTAAVLLGIGVVALVPAVLGTHYVVRGKVAARDRLLDRIEWRGNEQVLDVGTGGGLLAIGAAKRTLQGRAFGIDTWRTEDLSRNTKARVIENARIEGVADRVEIRDDDARALSFDDSTIDVVVSMLCIHNIDDTEGRLKALDEMVRVLRPGGMIALSDLAGIDAYAEHLRHRGLEVEVTSVAWDTFPFQRLLVARRRVAGVDKTGG